MRQHGLSEDHTVIVLFLCDVLVIRMAQLPEIIKCPSHVHFLFRGHVKEGQVNSAAPAVSGMFVDIALWEQDILVKVRIKILLHTGIIRIQRPVHEVGHRPLRTVGVKDLQAVSLLNQFIAYFLKRRGGLFCKKRQRFFISVYPSAHKVVA